MLEKCCKNCDHHKGGPRPICELPLPWWVEPHDRPAVYGSEGGDCPSFYNPTAGITFCDSCGTYAADLPSTLCVGCEAYRDHTQ